MYISTIYVRSCSFAKNGYFFVFDVKRQNKSHKKPYFIPDIMCSIKVTVQTKGSIRTREPKHHSRSFNTIQS
jgi:hypothetical protein